MIKANYLSYKLDVIEAVGSKFEAQYIDSKARHLIVGSGHNVESACADAQKKIKKRVNGETTTSD